MSAKSTPKKAPTPRARVSAARATEAATDVAASVVSEALNLDGRVLVNVPEAFSLTDDTGTTYSFAKGVIPMSPAHRDHWYSKANGVTPFNPQ
jgi:hypothetical protein